MYMRAGPFGDFRRAKEHGLELESHAHATRIRCSHARSDRRYYCAYAGFAHYGPRPSMLKLCSPLALSVQRGHAAGLAMGFFACVPWLGSAPGVRLANDARPELALGRVGRSHRSGGGSSMSR